MRATIAGTGHYLPGPAITNGELIARHGLKVKSYFIRNSVGAETRHFAAAGEATSDLAVEAGARAIAASGLPARAIRRILLATVSGDYPTPATACVVQRKLGLAGAAAIDVVGACSGFIQALDLGARCVATGEAPVLVIGAVACSLQPRPGVLLVGSIEIGDEVLVGGYSHISPDVRIGVLSILEHAVGIGPHVTIGERVRIGAGTAIYQRATIGNAVVIGKGCIIPAHARIPDGTCIGDGTVLPATRLGPDRQGVA